MPNFVSSEAQDLIRRILVVNPVDRITTAEILYVKKKYEESFALKNTNFFVENILGLSLICRLIC